MWAPTYMIRERELTRLRKLRRLAASTNFPNEARIARRMAERIEKQLGVVPDEDIEVMDAATAADVIAWQQFVHALPVKAGDANDVRTRYLFESMRVFGHAPLDARLK